MGIDINFQRIHYSYIGSFPCRMCFRRNARLSFDRSCAFRGVIAMRKTFVPILTLSLLFVASDSSARAKHRWGWRGAEAQSSCGSSGLITDYATGLGDVSGSVAASVQGAWSGATSSAQAYSLTSGSFQGHFSTLAAGGHNSQCTKPGPSTFQAIGIAGSGTSWVLPAPGPLGAGASTFPDSSAVAVVNCSLGADVGGVVKDTLSALLKVAASRAGGSGDNHRAYLRFSVRDSLTGALLDTVYATLAVDASDQVSFATNLDPSCYVDVSSSYPGMHAFRVLCQRTALASGPDVEVYLEGGVDGSAGIPALAPWGMVALVAILVAMGGWMMRRRMLAP